MADEIINEKKFNEGMSNLRDAIDNIDGDLVKLINKRLNISKQVGELKEKFNSQVLDKSRENIIMERLSRLNQGPVSNTTLQYIFSVLIAASRELQKPQTISYLGPAATYTHIAAMNHFGYSGKFVPQTTIGDIFIEVARGASLYGVIPVENSIEGAVNYTLDLLFESDVKICGEKYQIISHDLLSETGNINDIKVIYSHPQAFSQCRTWLQENLPGVSLEECGSTARAAKKIVGNKNAAAIASNKAAVEYNLKIVESKIEDFTKNVTRFLIIAKDEVAKTTTMTGNDKTTIMFVTSHTSGALFKTLDPIAKAGLNLVKLESRPIRNENWSYFFIADIEGHIDDPIIKKAIDQIGEISLFLKCVGSYPKAQEGYQEIQ
ncbi:MAG: prephenate dehydratase [Desulfobacteraceae bacterium 4572_19]|nr:MAG: prephenate dehydratase [Desulfobacteraceae bacterium 4572_19]